MKSWNTPKGCTFFYLLKKPLQKNNTDNNKNNPYITPIRKNVVFFLIWGFSFVGFPCCEVFTGFEDEMNFDTHARNRGSRLNPVGFQQPTLLPLNNPTRPCTETQNKTKPARPWSKTSLQQTTQSPKAPPPPPPAPPHLLPPPK